MRSVGVVVAGCGCAAMAAYGQAPSFTRYVTPHSADAIAISPDGRFVAGTTRVLATISQTAAFRWNRLTGAASAAPIGHLGRAVLDDGRVYGWWRDGSLLAHRGFRWNPTGDVFDYGTFVTHPDRFWYITSMARDGAYGGGDTDAGSPIYVQYEGGGSGLAVALTAPDGTGMFDPAGVHITLPIDGVRYAYGTMNFPSVGSAGVVWRLPFLTGTRDTTWRRIRGVTPRGERLLGTTPAGQEVVRGDGADWVLQAPISPVIMSGAGAVAMSDDGRVVVGTASNPAGSATTSEGVVWRKGLAPARLREIMASAGIALPAFDRAVLRGISADGSVVCGTYYTGQDVSATDIGNAFVAVLPAVNDACAGATPVTYGTTVASTNGATRATGGAGTCATEGAAPDVWFSFVPAANEVVSIDTCGSSFDTTLAMYAGSCAAPGAAVACNDNAAPACEGTGTSRISASVFAGQTYLIRVSGVQGAFGSVRLTITAPARPVNDTCAQATSVAPGTGVPFTTVNALTDNRPNCAGGGTPFSDVWFRCVAPENGRMTFSTCGSTINTVMIVYDGSACGDVNATPLACAQSNAGCAVVGGGVGTRLTVPCAAGQDLLIRVGGLFGASGTGQFMATFACDAEVSNDYALAVRATNPLDYYRFEDSGTPTAADSIRFDAFSCGDNRGEYVGNVSRPREFQGKCLSLSGDGAHARVWGATPITNPNGCPAFSSAIIEAWVKTTDPEAGVVFTNRNDPSQHSLTMVIGYNTVGIPNTQGRVMFISDGPGNFFGAISGARVDDGRWHHIVGFRYHDGGSQYYYSIHVDDVWQGTNNLPGVGSTHFGTSGAYWLIGNGTAWPTAGAAFNGKIDEVAVYCGNPPLSEWTHHFEVGRPCAADVDDDGDLSNGSVQDASVDINDLLFFLAAFEAGDVSADLDDGSGTGRPDQGVDINDLIYFLTHFEAGC